MKKSRKILKIAIFAQKALKINDFLEKYQNDTFARVITEKLNEKNPHLLISSTFGSLDAILVAAIAQNHPAVYLHIQNSKEEAHYFYSDLVHLLDKKEPNAGGIFLFPQSHKQFLEIEEVKNANILMRSEVLSTLVSNTPFEGNKRNERIHIITYPEALIEKVTNKKTLLSHTLTLQKGASQNREKLLDFLTINGFEKTDFVYESGQYAIRGGIVDIYSFSNEFPYRFDFFGDEIESIRTFNPDYQTSLEDVLSAQIVPNVRANFEYEKRESLVSFLPENCVISFQSSPQFFQEFKVIEENLREKYNKILHTVESKKILPFEELFTSKQSISDFFKHSKTIEFGKKSCFSDVIELSYLSKAQPKFSKNFEVLAKNLAENQAKNIQSFIASETFKQHERLRTIFDEINPNARFQPLLLGLRGGFIDENMGIVCYTDHQIFERFYQFQAREKFTKKKALTLKELNSLQVGDFVTHIDFGIGRFAGIGKMDINGKEQEVIRLVYKDNDMLFVSIYSLSKISKYVGKEGITPAITKLGSSEWKTKKSRVKKQIQTIASELIKLYAQRKTAHGYAFSQDSFWQAELESSFLYEDTPDQARATQEVKLDMEKPHPMDRLVCGDVGFGKTEVAIRAAFKAVVDGKQVAVLVPTTVLALQHYQTFKNRLENFPCKVEYVNRFKTSQQIKETLERVSKGETNILIGTHRLVNSDVKFKNLGLLIIDEEQKFGVKVKDKLKQMSIGLDVLTLTATPIPRTLHFSLMGARDLSIIATPPPNRQPIQTEIHLFDEEIIRDALAFELQRNGQVFFVHNRVGNIETIANQLLKLVPDAKIGIAHGQMEGEVLERIMLRFMEGTYDILVSTNIIESGLDISNANTIIINDAHLFGLSDLHQMRGRVGRSDRKAYCYLLSPSKTVLSSDAQKRLSALEEFADLGDGFRVAMRDLDIRGAGNLLGAEQSGFINDLGYEAYHKILDEAVEELKETTFKELFEANPTQSLLEHLQRNKCQIETDWAVLIPDNYVSAINERLNLYIQLDALNSEEELENFRKMLIDRFGSYPPSVALMLDLVKIRWKAQRLGIEKITLKNSVLRAFFVSKNEAYFESDIFGKVIEYVQKNPLLCSLKEQSGKPLLVRQSINDYNDLAKLFKEMA